MLAASTTRWKRSRNWGRTDGPGFAMDVEVILMQCNNGDTTTHKCPGRRDKFFMNGDNAVCICECHKKKEAVPA